MTEGIGKALATAIKEPATPEQDKAGALVFQNRNRRRLFSALTLTPCIGVVRLAEREDMAKNTVKWHLESLIRAGFIVKHADGRNVVYYPEGLINCENASLFSTVNHALRGVIYKQIANGPGATQGDLAALAGRPRHVIRRALNPLCSNGLVSAMEDGSFRSMPGCT